MIKLGKDGNMEYRYRRSRRSRRSKMRKQPIIISLLALAIVVTGVFWFLNKDGKYDKYRKYDEGNKSFAEVEHYEKDDDNFFISLYYPKTKIDKLDKIIDKYRKDFVDNQKTDKKEKTILYMDYSIEKVYDEFVNLKLTTKKFDEENNLLEKAEKIYCYDDGKGKILTVKDALRNNFKSLLSNINGIDKVDENSENIVVNKRELLIYTSNDLKNKIEIKYQDNKNAIKLANKNIPSNAPLDVAAPAAEPEIDPNKKMIAITLDDGPHKTNTLRVVEMFEKYNGRATFFQLGKNIELYPDVVKTVYEHGFEIANHSWDHPDLRKKDSAGVNQQVANTQDIIFKITGEEPKLIRPPYGAFNDNVKSVIYNNGMQIALWSVDTEDWKLKDANKIKDAILKNAFDGAVILLHDIHNFSVDGLEMALSELSQRGYQFVTLSTLQKYKELKQVIR